MGCSQSIQVLNQLPSPGVTLHRSVLFSARFAGTSLKKTLVGSDAKPMDTTILFQCVMSHSGCFEFCPLPMCSINSISPADGLVNSYFGILFPP